MPHTIRRGGRTGLLAVVTAVLFCSLAGSALAGTANVNGTTLTFTAGDGEVNNVTITLVNGGNTLRVTDTGTAAPTPTVTCTRPAGTPGNAVDCPATTVTTIAVQLGDLGDTINLLDVGTRTSTLDGGTGDDMLNGSPNADTLRGGDGDDVLLGEGGNDALDGGLGDDELDGGAGDDTLNGGPGPRDATESTPAVSDDDAIEGGAGTDTVDYSARTEDVMVTIGAAMPGDGEMGETDDVRASVENVTTGSGDDTIIAFGDTPNVLDGGEGDDTLQGLGGNDRLEGRGGADTLDGGDGNDTLNGAAGNDELQGGAGVDVLNGQDGDDELQGGAGSDTFNGGAGTDTASYEDHPGGVTADLDGAAGDDGNATDGAAGARDTIAADVENLTGSPGDDRLTGSVGANVLSGVGGNDVLLGGSGTDPDGADVFNGGDGTDTASYETRSDALTVTIDDVANDGAAGEGDNVRTDVENVIGGSANDVLTGDGDANVLEGRGGNDALDGRLGADTLLGGAGFDSVIYADRTADVTVTLDGMANDGQAEEGDAVGPVGGTSDVERVVGGSGDDVLVGTAGAQTLEGRGGDDTLDGGLGGDELIGGTGTDTVTYAGRTVAVVANLDGARDDGQAGENDRIDVSVENLVGGSGGDTLSGSAEANLLQGNDGADIINGLGGDDRIEGGAGDDMLDGSTGADSIDGGAGTDAIRGGSGDDRIFARDNTVETVDCGAGANDQAVVDPDDKTTNCDAGVETRPVVSVSDATAVEGDALTFTVTLSSPSPDTVTVDFTTVGGTAMAPEDFEGTMGTVTFAPGETSMTVTVPTTEDTADEPDETVTLTLTNPTQATLGDATGTGTIVDDDGTPTVSIGDTTIEEGGLATFTVSLSNPSDTPVTVSFATSNGTATSAQDYTDTSGTVTFRAGTTTQTVTVQTTEDAIDEPDETFTVTLSDPSGAELGDSTATGTITDDDGTPAVSVADATAAEGEPATFRFTLSNPSSQTVTVSYTTTTGTAGAADFTTETGTVTFAPGETTATEQVATTEDTADEPDEAFTVTITDVANATIEDGSATGTITDDDGTPTVSVADATATEGDAVAFTLTLSNPSSTPVTVRYATEARTATAPADFTAETGTVTFQPGQTTATEQVATVEDQLDETAETFGLRLSEPAGATIADGIATGTITDDDDVPAVSVDDAASVTEGDSGTRNATFTLRLASASGRTVTVDVATADDTAKAGEDFTTKTGTVTFSPGQTAATVEVAVLGDTAVEADEAFRLVLSNPSGARLGDASATAQITNDDRPAEAPSVSVADVSVNEGEPVGFRLTLSRPATGAVSVRYATVDGPAKAGTDFGGVTGTATFAAGETVKVVPVSTTQDALDEANEAFALSLSDPQGLAIADGTGVAIIVDDDSAAVTRQRAAITARVLPARDRTRPFRYTLTGRITPPSGVDRTRACASDGVVTAQVKRRTGRSTSRRTVTVSTRRGTMRNDCTFRITLRLNRPERLGDGRLKVTVRFGGNVLLLPRSVKALSVRAG